MGRYDMLDRENELSTAAGLQGEGGEPRPIGPSDSSDSGSDLMGAEGGDEAGAGDSSDRNGTGERLSADTASDVRVAGDITADRIVTADEAGLGGGLDQAEEARLGITDEELAQRLRRN